MAQAQNLVGAIDTTPMNPLLARLQHKDATLQEISNSLYGLGLMAQAQNLVGAIDTTPMNTWLVRLQHKDAKPQDISNSLYGLGLMAQAQNLVGTIDTTPLNRLLARLQHKDATLQEISNSLYGLGLMAQAQNLVGSIDTTPMNTWLVRLQHKDAKPQEISNSLYGLGLMARAQKLAGSIDTAPINTWLGGLQPKDAKPQDISNSLYGLGLMAQAQNLVGAIDTTPLNPLLVRLQHKDAKPQEISNSLYGLGLMARAQNLLGVIDTTPMNTLLVGLGRGDIDTQAVSNSLYSLGLMARAQKLAVAIDTAPLNPLLARLQHKDTTSQHISNSLYGLGLMAQAQNLVGSIDTTPMNPLLVRLQHKDATLQEISNSLYGLGLMAQAQNLVGAIDTAPINTWLVRLQPKDAKPQDISNSLYGLGLMARAQKLVGAIDTAPMNTWLVRLQHQDTKLQEIGNSLYGLGMLQRHQPMTLNFELLLRLARRAAPDSVSNTASTVHLFYGMAYLSHAHTKRWLQSDALPCLLTTLDHRYLHPVYAAKVFIAVTKLAAVATHPPFNRLLQRLRAELGPVETLLPPDIQAELTEIRTLAPARAEPRATRTVPEDRSSVQASPRVDEQPGLQERLDSPARRHHPVAQATRAERINNRLYAAISQNNWEAFKKLLPLKPTSTSASASGVSGRSRHTAPIRGVLSKRMSYEPLVMAFFDLPVQDIQTLAAQQTKADYFTHLLYHVSAHRRYQLAKAYQLNPLILHLPSAPLTAFCQQLLSPLQLYRDQHAFLAVIDALTLRARYNRLAQEACEWRQQELLGRAIEFHEKCDHRHVVARLRPLLNSLGTCLLAQPQDTLALAPDAVAPPRPIQPSVHAHRVCQTRATLFQSCTLSSQPRLGQRSSPPHQVNLDYRYEAENIQLLLRASLADYPGVTILAAADLDGTANTLTDVLRQFFEHLPALQRRWVLVPICCSNATHWVGIALKFDADGMLEKANYYDSLAGGATVLTRCQMQLDQGIAWNNPRHIGLTVAQQGLRQTDASSCGAVLIAHFHWAVSGQAPALLGMQALRENQLRMLAEFCRENGDMASYQRFYQQQLVNRPSTEPEQHTQALSSYTA